jgi:cytochrome b involved in lipid metabolism
MKFRAYSSVLLTAVFLSAVSMPSQAATVTGTKCTKVGTFKTVSKVKYVCVKSGNKIIWNKVSAVKATPKATASSTAKATSSPSAKPVASVSPTQSKIASPSASAKSGLTQLTLEEVQKRDSATSCWSIVYGNVFDLTKWITKHPGGAEKIRAICGKDGTSSFENKHTGDARAANQLSSYFLGKLGESVKL